MGKPLLLADAYEAAADDFFGHIDDMLFCVGLCVQQLLDVGRYMDSPCVAVCLGSFFDRAVLSDDNRPLNMDVISVNICPFQSEYLRGTQAEPNRQHDRQFVFYALAVKYNFLSSLSVGI